MMMDTVAEIPPLPDLHGKDTFGDDVASALQQLEHAICALAMLDTFISIGILSAREEMYVYSSFDPDGVIPTLNCILVLLFGNWATIALCRTKTRQINAVWWAKCSMTVLQFVGCVCICSRSPDGQDGKPDPRWNGTIEYGLAYLLVSFIGAVQAYALWRVLRLKRRRNNTAKNYGKTTATPLFHGINYQSRLTDAPSWDAPVIQRMTLGDSRRFRQERRLAPTNPANIYSEDFSEMASSDFTSGAGGLSQYPKSTGDWSSGN